MGDWICDGCEADVYEGDHDALEDAGGRGPDVFLGKVAEGGQGGGAGGVGVKEGLGV